MTKECRNPNDGIDLGDSSFVDRRDRWSPFFGMRPVAITLAVCCFACSAWSQEPSAAVPQVAVSSGGGPFFVPDTWGAIQLTFANPRSAGADLLCLTYIEKTQALQYGRRVWVPPQARLRLWQPIRLPPSAGGAPSLDYHTLLSDVRASSEVLLADSGARLVRDGALTLGSREKVTGFIDTHELTSQGKLPAESVRELVLAARGQTAAMVRTAIFQDSPLPFYGPESLEAVDCLVIADDRLLTEPVALAAVRRWLHSGGRAWILLDQVDPQLPELLLGDEFACQVVDRIGLTEVAFTAGPEGAVLPEETITYEEPVDFVRVVAGEIDVLTMVQGWPAAMLKRFGDGRLLLTTLAPDGWLRPAPRPRDPTLPATMAAALAARAERGREGTIALRNVAADFFRESPPPLVAPAALEPVASEYIGYRIPSAAIVVGLLGLFNAVLVGAGLVLLSRGRLDHIGYVVPLAALSVAALLVIVGRIYRQGLVPTAASVQVVQLLPGTDDQRVVGAAALSSGRTLPAGISSSHGGWAELKMAEEAASMRRMVWTDHESWRWENLRQRAGLQLSAYQSSTTAVPRIDAVATLSAEGLTGKLELADQAAAEDCLIVTRDGRIGVELQRDGTFLAPTSGVMSHRQFLAAGLLTDEQNRRQRVLAELLAGRRRADFPDRPHLFFWTSSWNSGIDFGESLRPIGSTLVAVPLRLVRPPAGTEVAIPAPLMAYHSVGGPDGTAAGGMYDNRQRQWVERSRPSLVWLEFQVPQVLLPLEGTEAHIVCEVNGPLQQLEVATFDQGKVTPLATWRTPVGTLTARISDRQHLQLSPRGTLLLRVAAGGPVATSEIDAEATGEGRASYWRIESLRLELRGRVLDDR